MSSSKKSDHNNEFCLACARGDLSAVQTILSKSPESVHCLGPVAPEHREHMTKADAAEGWTPLHLAAYYGHGPVVEVLISMGAKVNVRSENAIGNTPLMAAIAGGHLELATYLMKRGADPTLSDKTGLTAAQLALANGHMEFAEKILRLRPWG